MSKVVPVVDKIHSHFYINQDIKVDGIVLYLENKNIILKNNTDSLKSGSYELNKDVYFKNEFIGYISLKHRAIKGMCRLRILNKLLYTNQSLVIEFYNYLTSLEYFNYFEFGNLEFALDTNQPLIKRYESKINNDVVEMDKSYKGDIYTTEYKNNKFVRDLSKATRYIKQQANSFDKSVDGEKRKREKRTLRIEDKKLLLDGDVTGKRNYIKKYLEDKGIDISKNHYRIELTLKGKDSLITSNNIVYYNDNNEYVSAYIMNKAKKTIASYNDSDLFGPQSEYLKAKDILDNYTNRKTLSKMYDIKIEDLFNEDFLFNLFFNESKKIIYNIDSIINVNYKKNKLKMKNLDVRKREFKGKGEFDNDLRLQTLSYLHRQGLLTDEEYNKKLDLVNNIDVKVDLFDLEKSGLEDLI